MTRFILALALLLPIPAKADEPMPETRFTTATYRVDEERQAEFLELLKGCEAEMRELRLITDRPIIRMRSLEDPRLILEIFEWTDPEAFGRAQKEPRILQWWGKYEHLWEEGGFGLEAFPEAQKPWAQFKPVD